jgi:hypothetical protein
MISTGLFEPSAIGRSSDDRVDPDGEEVTAGGAVVDVVIVPVPVPVSLFVILVVGTVVAVVDVVIVPVPVPVSLLVVLVVGTVVAVVDVVIVVCDSNLSAETGAPITSIEKIIRPSIRHLP